VCADVIGIARRERKMGDIKNQQTSELIIFFLSFLFFTSPIIHQHQPLKMKLKLIQQYFPSISVARFFLATLANLTAQSGTHFPKANKEQLKGAGECERRGRRKKK
jgi:hypothetical protein